MTSIDSTVIPEVLAEEYLDTTIEDNETHVSALGEPKIVIMTAQQIDSTALPSYSISGRTITFHLWDRPPVTAQPDGAHSGAVAYAVLIKGRL